MLYLSVLLLSLQVCHGVQMPCRDWRAVIAGMGANGWELATIVEVRHPASSSLIYIRRSLLLNSHM